MKKILIITYIISLFLVGTAAQAMRSTNKQELENYGDLTKAARILEGFKSSEYWTNDKSMYETYQQKLAEFDSRGIRNTPQKAASKTLSHSKYLIYLDCFLRRHGVSLSLKPESQNCLQSEMISNHTMSDLNQEDHGSQSNQVPVLISPRNNKNMKNTIEAVKNIMPQNRKNEYDEPFSQDLKIDVKQLKISIPRDTCNRGPEASEGFSGFEIKDCLDKKASMAGHGESNLPVLPIVKPPIHAPFTSKEKCLQAIQIMSICEGTDVYSEYSQFQKSSGSHQEALFKVFEQYPFLWELATKE